MKEGITSNCMYAWEIYVNKPKFDDRKLRENKWLQVETESIWQKQDAMWSRGRKEIAGSLVRSVTSRWSAWLLLQFYISKNGLYTKMCSILLGCSLSDTSFGSDPVPEGSHSSINTGFIGMPTFISPAHYSSEVPDISSIWTNQWSSGVTLKEKGEIGN